MLNDTRFFSRLAPEQAFPIRYHAPTDQNLGDALATDPIVPRGLRGASSASLTVAPSVSAASAASPSAQATIVWRNYATGENVIWQMNGTTPSGTIPLPTVTDLNWRIEATADFNGDGQQDLLWRNYGTTGSEAGKVYIWTMNGQTATATIVMPVVVNNPNWRIDAVGDFNQDGLVDLVWRNYDTTGIEAGKVSIWTMNGVTPIATVQMPLIVNNPNWRIETVGDFNQDGKADLVWRNYDTAGIEAGKVYIWTMNGLAPVTTVQMPLVINDLNWHIEGAGDFTDDRKFDLLWRNSSTGKNTLWQMDGTTPIASVDLPDVSAPNWVSIVSAPPPPIATIIRIPTTNQTNDITFTISGNNLAWQGWDGQDYEIFLYNGTTGVTQQLTNNTVNDVNPKISGLNVVWEHVTGTNNRDVYFYNGTQTIILSNSAFDDANPIISGSNVVWERQMNPSTANSNKDLYLYNGTTTIALATNPLDDTNASISGSNVVWRSFFDIDPDPAVDNPSADIFFYNGATTRRLTNNDKDESSLRIVGANVFWIGMDNNFFDQIFLFNGATVRQLTTGNNAIPALGITVSGSNIVWQVETGAFTRDLYFYNAVTNTATKIGSAVAQGSGVVTVRVAGSNVAWSSFDGNDKELFLYNGATTRQVTHNTTNDVLFGFSGSRLIWKNSGGNGTFVDQGGAIGQLPTGNAFPITSGDYLAWAGVENGVSLFLAQLI
ncbi:MAG: FG-GAP repeat protein [Scytolyngbya sp. HA4215-MV1]|jgi:hypothetical protein|nr:FG-GAP repeat protein [Scytolyngbya sp. HA4215-MV1]